MKFIKLSEEINIICRNYHILNYTINSDGSIDVDNDVDLYGRGLIKLPLNFGKVSGNFHCNENKLTTLEGCPQSIGGDFSCMSNNLTTLEGSPQSVGGDFSCRNNRLISLEGCPQSVGGYFNFRSNQLKDLYGFPEFFDGNIYYSVNPVSEILYLFPNRLVKVIELLNEYNVIRQNGKLVILDRLEEVFHTLNMDIPKEINLKNYEVD